MNKREINNLELLIAGQYYSEKLLNKAITFADNLEVSVCLKAIKGGRTSDESRFVLQDFVVRLAAGQV